MIMTEVKPKLVHGSAIHFTHELDCLPITFFKQLVQTLAIESI